MTALTGVPTVAACFLLPIGVVLYTLFGGIKATFITDYMHTVVILVVIFLFAFSAYATNAELGSPGKVYDALVAAAKAHPVEGNAEGSYLTMRSKEGGIFWIINLIGEFSKTSFGQGCPLINSQAILELCSLTMATTTKVMRAASLTA